MKQKNNAGIGEIHEGEKMLGIAGFDQIHKVLIFLGVTIFLIALAIMLFGRFL